MSTTTTTTLATTTVACDESALMDCGATFGGCISVQPIHTRICIRAKKYFIVTLARIAQGVGMDFTAACGCAQAAVDCAANAYCPVTMYSKHRCFEKNKRPDHTQHRTIV